MSTICNILVVLLIISYFNVSFGSNNVKCESKVSCSICIQTPNCVWCKQKKGGLKEFPIRCYDEKTILNYCPEQDVVRPQSKIINTKSVGVLGEDAVQIQPQSISLSMKVGEEFIISLQYQQAKDYPIDLYFLMDFSNSMLKHRNTLVNVAYELKSQLLKLSNNVHIGFGSFVDKVVMPFHITSPEIITDYCQDQGICDPYYNFIHRMKLSNDTDFFTKTLNETNMSINYDYPEGGFDGLLQTIVCQEQIGWREKASKLLIYMSDASYHIAGDGKLGGIVEPNDEKCHLNKDGRYTHGLKQDYPSVYQIARQASKNNIKIIFAISNSYFRYNLLENHIPGSSVIELLRDSSNLIEIISNEYKKMTNSIKLIDDSSGIVEIKYFTSCNKNKIKQTNECLKLKGRPKIDFQASIKVLQCPENKNEWNQTIKISPELVNESVSIDLKIQCQCDCELRNMEFKSKLCNEKGTLTCGICLCDPERYGRTCECSKSDTMKDNTIEELNNCKPNEATNVICSNRGMCECGKCECIQRKNSEELIYGTFCECDNFTCPINAMLICSGPERGLCDCGECKCKSGWSGKACECKETNVTCTAPGSEKVCSGNGKCECGQCKCIETNNFRYSGTYCQDCTNCPAQRCKELQPCVECLIHQTGIHDKAECTLKCSSYKIDKVDSIENNETVSNIDKICRVPDNAGCTIIFKYKYKDDNQNLEIEAQRTKECSKEIDLLVVILSVIGTTVLIGIITLAIWKILTIIHDNREFSRFLTESKLANFENNENPLYKTPTTTFTNPTFQS